MQKKSATIISLLSQILLCAGGLYALWQLAPYFPGFPWVKKYSATTTTDFLLRNQLLQEQNERLPSPSAILRQELTPIPLEQNILFVGDPQHPSHQTIKFLIAYFAYPRRVVTPICNLPNEAKNSVDPAKLAAVVFFGKLPNVALSAAPVTILPGLELRKLEGEEKWQSFCSR